jgi:hypothetical protein
MEADCHSELLILLVLYDYQYNFFELSKTLAAVTSRFHLNLGLS